MMSNNDLLKKISISHNLKRSDVQEIFEMSNYDLSVSQISALFASEKNKNYEALSDSMLFAFLNSLIRYSRGSQDEPNIPPRSVLNSVLGLAEKEDLASLMVLQGFINDAITSVEEGKFDEFKNDLFED